MTIDNRKDVRKRQEASGIDFLFLTEPDEKTAIPDKT